MSSLPMPAWGNSRHWGQLPKRILTKHSASMSKGFCSLCKKALLSLFQDGGSIILSASTARIQRIRGVQCLQRDEGRDTVIRAHMDSRSETTQDPRQRHQPWSDRHTGPKWLDTESAKERAIKEEPREHRAYGSNG